jgi:hypothetical protein
VTSEQPQSEAGLTDEQRALLVAAHRRLDAANADYDRFIGAELRANEPVPVHDGKAVAEAQAEIEAAESDLWRLREELLGWHRP